MNIIIKKFLKLKGKFDIFWIKLKSHILSNLFLSCGKKIFIGKNVDIKGFNNIMLGHNVVLANNCQIHAWESYREQVLSPKLIIGDNFLINNNSYITCCNSIIIKDNVLCGGNVLISDNSHGNINNFEQECKMAPIERPLFSKGTVVIGNNVWIGQNVVILSDSYIGDNSIVAANSVVNKKFPDNVLIAGAPARIVKYLK